MRRHKGGKGCAGVQRRAALGRGVRVRRGAAVAQGVLHGTEQGQSAGLRMGPRWGCAGGSEELRWGTAAAEGAQRVAEQWAQNAGGGEICDSHFSAFSAFFFAFFGQVP